MSEHTWIPEPPPTSPCLTLGRFSVLRDADLRRWTIRTESPEVREVLISGCVLTECDLRGLRWEHLEATVIRDCREPDGYWTLARNCVIAEGGSMRRTL